MVKQDKEQNSHIDFTKNSLEQANKLEPNPVLEFSDFCFYAENNNLIKPSHYIDKTAIIATLIRNRGAYSLCRPRRFGKTVTLDVIRDLFINGLKNFSDCAIAKEKMWEQEGLDKTYPVLLLSFGSFVAKSIEAFDKSLSKLIRTAAKQNKIILSETETEPSDLISSFFEQVDSQVVILVDEYDLPLIDSMENQDIYHHVQTRLAQLYSALKQYERNIRFMLVTGVNRVSNMSIFSGFNNIIDISLNPMFATIVGYTEQELHDNFAEPLSKIAKYYDLSYIELIERLKLSYNGYCFDPTLQQTVFNTWDINSFLYSPRLLRPLNQRFPSYWASDAVISNFVLQYFKFKKLNFIDFIKQNIFSKIDISLAELSKKESFYETSIAVFMFNAGYLTLKEVNNESFVIAFPNEHVKNFVVNDLVLSLKSFNHAWHISFNNIKYDLQQIFELKTSDEVRKDILTSALVAVGVKANDCFDKEAQLRTLLCLMFKCCELDVQFEVSILGGRIDLLVHHKNVSFIIELKVIHSVVSRKKLSATAIAKLSHSKLKEAFAQISKQEYQRVVPSSRTLVLGGIVADCSSGKITDLKFKSYN